MVIGGFNHYDFGDVELSTTAVAIPGIYDYFESNYPTKKPFIITGLVFNEDEEGVEFFPNTYVGGLYLNSETFGIPLVVTGDLKTSLNFASININADDEVFLIYNEFPSK